MKLNVRLQSEQSAISGSPVVLIHGLFGSLDNLAVLARGLKDNHPIVQIDVRNHGLSPHAAEMNYLLMAQDVLETLDNLGIDQFCRYWSLHGRQNRHDADRTGARASETPGGD